MTLLFTWHILYADALPSALHILALAANLERAGTDTEGSITLLISQM